MGVPPSSSGGFHDSLTCSARTFSFYHSSTYRWSQIPHLAWAALVCLVRRARSRNQLLQSWKGGLFWRGCGRLKFSWWFHWWRLIITDIKMTMMTFLPRKWAWSCKGLCPPPCPLSSLSTPGQGSTSFLGWPLSRSLSTCGRSNNNGWRSPYSSRNRQSSLPSARGWSVHLAARQCQHLLWNHFWWTAFNNG